MQIEFENKAESVCRSNELEIHSADISKKNGLVAVRIGNDSGQAQTLMTRSEALIVALALAREARSL
jgi:hypothetical protein